ncbi:MAG: hypothetical protein AAFO75_01225, partial [Pseudomonadota bacterium]
KWLLRNNASVSRSPFDTLLVTAQRARFHGLSLHEDIRRATFSARLAIRQNAENLIDLAK